MNLREQVDVEALEPQDVFLRHHCVIEQVIRTVCRCHRLTPEDAADFTGLACVHLLEDECAVLRLFSGRSSMATYLTTVITHLAQDWRNTRWGKWRPSAAAKRKGSLALHLERLLCRDGLTLDEAFETLRTNHQVTATREELERLASTFPARWRRRIVSLDANGAKLASLQLDPLVERAARRRASAAALVLRRTIDALSSEERYLLALRFRDGIRIADIARRLRHPEKPLYRQFERVLDRLRQELVSHGFTAATLRDAFEHMGVAGIHPETEPFMPHPGTRSPSAELGDSRRDISEPWPLVCAEECGVAAVR